MIEHILKYFPSLSDTQKEQFRLMTELYPQWNEKINVISRKDIANVEVNHILHSLAIAKFINFKPGSRVLDFGSGGGLPGLPLAVMFPEVHFHLIDRIGKKVMVAREIAEGSGLTNVSFQHGDIGECRNTYDFVVSRAVMRLDELLPLIKKNMSHTSRNAYPNGLICLKGGDLSSELHGIKNPVIEEPLNRYFDEPFFETKKLIYVQI